MIVNVSTLYRHRNFRPKLAALAKLPSSRTQVTLSLIVKSNPAVMQ